MPLRTVNEESTILAKKLFSILDVPRFDDTDRVRVSDVACSMSLEHWNATRLLLGAGLLPSGLVVHRAQFESLVRSVWVLYAAPDEKVGKLSATLTAESEQAAKGLPQIAEMMGDLSSKAPPQAYDALSRFKDNSWKALNSYAHAGIHPLRRHEEGYPERLVESVLRNANGLAIVAGMQAAALSGRQALVREILSLGLAHASCMPPPQ